MLRRITFCLMALAILVAATGAFAARMAPEERREGYFRLFNGKDLDGWTVMGEPAWSVKDGVIHCTGAGYGWLRTNDTYKDFVVRLEYRIAKDGNSGMFLRAKLEGDPAFSGMELQILDDAGKPADKHSSTALYDALAPTKNMAKPAWEWNTVEISMIGGHLQCIHNGEKVIDTDIYDPGLNAPLTADRKFASRAKVGFIGFQNHHTENEFRNVRIKVLETKEGETK